MLSFSFQSKQTSSAPLRSQQLLWVAFSLIWLLKTHRTSFTEALVLRKQFDAYPISRFDRNIGNTVSTGRPDALVSLHNSYGPIEMPVQHVRRQLKQKEPVNEKTSDKNAVQLKVQAGEKDGNGKTQKANGEQSQRKHDITKKINSHQFRIDEDMAAMQKDEMYVVSDGLPELSDFDNVAESENGKDRNQYVFESPDDWPMDSYAASESLGTLFEPASAPSPAGTGAIRTELVSTLKNGTLFDGHYHFGGIKEIHASTGHEINGIQFVYNYGGPGGWSGSGSPGTTHFSLSDGDGIIRIEAKEHSGNYGMEYIHFFTQNGTYFNITTDGNNGGDGAVRIFDAPEGHILGGIYGMTGGTYGNSLITVGFYWVNQTYSSVGIGISFVVMADTPYTDVETSCLEKQLQHAILSPTLTTNDTEQPLFIAHLGDIKAGSGHRNCVEGYYQNVSSIFQSAPVDTFFVPGDNEWVDCYYNAAEAWSYWAKHFGRDSSYSTFSSETPSVAWKSSINPYLENYAFFKVIHESEGVGFIGLNLVGSAAAPDAVDRMEANLRWVKESISSFQGQGELKVLILFGHADIFDTAEATRAAFGNDLKALMTSSYSDVQVWYFHGDGHIFRDEDTNSTLTSIQLDGGASAPPLLVNIARESTSGNYFVTYDRRGNRYSASGKTCLETYDSPTITYVPGDFVNGNEENGLLLSAGLKSRIVAETNIPVQYGDNKSSNPVVFHTMPDGAAVIPGPNGTYAYVSNSEGDDYTGGVGSIIFHANGTVKEYLRLLSKTKRNCSGGRSPWGTWISCEEFSGGRIWEVDPFGAVIRDGNPYQETKMSYSSSGEQQTMSFESVACDSRIADSPIFYVTVDNSYGGVRRFEPDATVMEKARLTGDYSDVLYSQGTVKYLKLISDPTSTSGGKYEWTDDYEAASLSAQAYFSFNEGMEIDGSTLLFVSKLQREVFALDLDGGTYDKYSTRTNGISGQPDQLNLVGAMEEEKMLYFCEDGGDRGIYVRTAQGDFVQIIKAIDYPGDESTGLAVSPDGNYMYFAMQDAGIVFQVWREDMHPFGAAWLPMSTSAKKENLGFAEALASDQKGFLPNYVTKESQDI